MDFRGRSQPQSGGTIRTSIIEFVHCDIHRDREREAQQLAKATKPSLAPAHGWPMPTFIYEACKSWPHSLTLQARNGSRSAFVRHSRWRAMVAIVFLYKQINIYIYIHRERARERERDTKRQRERERERRERERERERDTKRERERETEKD